MKLTREGKRFILATALIAVASFNTGNNLIYLILSMMLSIFLLSVILLKINMSKLLLSVFQNHPVFANTPSNLCISISNKKKKIPSFSLKVEIPGNTGAGTYFQYLPSQSEEIRQVPVIYKKRGLFGYGDFLLESGFPFIFVYKKVFCKIDGEVLVYPEIMDVNDYFLEMQDGDYAVPFSKDRKGDEFSTVREFRYGDDWRRIHWKASAKTSKFMMMEYTADDIRKATIILDNLKPFGSMSFEKAVSFTAGVIEKLIEEGFFVRMMTSRKVIPFGAGKEHFFKMLDILAVLEEYDSWDCPVTFEKEGYTILILKSHESDLGEFIQYSDTVIYANAL